MRVLGSISRAVNQFFGSVVMMLAVLVLIGGGALLIMLYGVNSYKETDGVLILRCWVDPYYPKCPEYPNELDRLRLQLEDMEADARRLRFERDRIEQQLAGLRAIETSVDEITLFNQYDDPYSGFTIAVGTVYQKFVNRSPQPEYHFCYIRLSSGGDGTNRDFHFHSIEGARDVAESKLDRLGIGAPTMAFARSVCKPFMIGGG